MSRFDRTQPPYYDFGDSEVSKQYYQLLAIPGRVAQAREISTLQTILQGIIKSLGDAILGNGDVIEGCQVIVSQDKKSVTVTEGKIYMEGIVTPVKATTVSVKGIGTETIGVRIKETIISEEDDSSLRDPAQGFDNYSQAGCNRIKRELVVVVDDLEASPIAILQDGNLTIENYAPTYDALSQTLARRTYDESGSYIVDGLSVHIEPKDENSYNVVAEAGKAYVLGYELKIPTARRIQNVKSTDVKTITDKEINYKENESSYVLDTNPYIKSITKVSGTLRENQIPVTRVSNGDTDDLNITFSSVSVVKIIQGETEYVVGTDCHLEGDRYLVWDTDNRPAPGTTYYVDITHRAVLTSGTDYVLEVSKDGSFLKFVEGGRKPENGALLIISLEKYLARRDVLYLDQYGNYSIVLGTPDEHGYEVAPNAPVNTLSIAQIHNPPNGSPNHEIPALTVQVTNIGLTRFTMNDIQNLLDRVKKTEYNQSVLTLNDDARSRSTLNSKKGILTDPIIDFSRIDLFYNKDQEGLSIDPSKPVYSMALNLDVGVAYLPLKVYNYPVESVTSDTTGRYGRLVTLKPTGENAVLSQLNATKSFQVNPYTVFPQLPEVVVTPAVDSWVEDTIVQVPVSLTNSTIVNTTTNILYDTVHRRIVQGGRFDNYTVTRQTGSSSSYADIVTGSTQNTITTESIVSEKAITYMRKIELTVEGKNFPPNLDNIKCTFDGIDVPLTPDGSTLKGERTGTLKADETGYVRGKFTIPNNIRTGIREVSLSSDKEVSGHQTTGYTLFQSSGSSRTIQRTLTTVTTVLLQREVTNTINQTVFEYIDPIGQTFVLDRVSVLKGVDVYFEAKPSDDSNQPVILEVRNVVNGTIGSTIYAHKSLNPSEVSVSANGSVPTRFNFSDPIVLEKNTEYAFTIRSISDIYRAWVSEIGGVDVGTKEVVLKNSYSTGVMMSSSNNSSWTTHQTMDLKFRLIEDIYDSTGSITFAPINVDEVTRLDLVAESVVLNGTGIDWHYSIDGGTTFYSITPGSLRELNTVANEVILRVDLHKTTSENITPLLAYDSLLLIGSCYELEGHYVGVNVSGMDPYNNVTVIMDTIIPNGTSLTPYMSPDNGNTLIKLELDSSQSRNLSNGWRELVYTGSLPDEGEATQCKIFIKGTSNSTIYTPKFSALKIIMD